MIAAIRRALIDWRFRRLTRPFDAKIEAARAKHQPVRDLQRAKTAFVHDRLRRELRA